MGIPPGVFLARKFFEEHSFWSENRKFSKAEAWIDLISEAAYKDHDIQIGWKKVRLRRGDVPHSIRTLSNRWGWGLGTVSKFLGHLENEGMVERKREHRFSVIRLCNYNTYQLTPKGQVNATVNGSRTDREQTESKESKESNKDPSSLSCGPCKQGVQDWWNRIASENAIPKMQKITEKRWRQWNARQSDSDIWDRRNDIAYEIASSEFVREWIKFDWIVGSQTNLQKLLEGQYRDRSARSGGTVLCWGMCTGCGFVYLQRRHAQEPARNAYCMDCGQGVRTPNQGSPPADSNVHKDCLSLIANK